jgi:hypothetical protein
MAASTRFHPIVFAGGWAVNRGDRHRRSAFMVAWLDLRTWRIQGGDASLGPHRFMRPAVGHFGKRENDRCLLLVHKAPCALLWQHCLKLRHDWAIVVSASSAMLSVLCLTA